LEAKELTVGEGNAYDFKLSENRLRVRADKGTHENICEEGETWRSAGTGFIGIGDYWILDRDLCFLTFSETLSLYYYLH